MLSRLLPLHALRLHTMIDTTAAHDVRGMVDKSVCNRDTILAYYGGVGPSSCHAMATVQQTAADTSPLKAALKVGPAGSPSESPTKPSFITVMLLAELLESLSPSHTLTARKHAAQQLQRYSRVLLNRTSICKLPGAVQKLVQLLTDQDAELREHSARTLCNLCCSNEANKDSIGQAPGAIRNLCKLLHEPAPATVAAAAATLSNLSHDHTDNQILIGRQPGAAAALLVLLAGQPEQQQPARVRIAAMRALECLAPHNQDSIAKESGAVQVLAACLSDTEASVRASAAATLQRLAWLHSDNQVAIACNTPGALAGLAALLQDPASARAREHAAAAVANLSFRNDAIKAAVAQQPGMLTGLIALLHDTHASVRGQAANALKALAARDVDIQTRVGAMCGAVKGLLSMLHESDTAVRQQAGDCLKCLAAGHTQNWFMIRKLAVVTCSSDLQMMSYILTQ